MNRLKLLLLLPALLLLSSCAESYFHLSPDSRLPKWFTIPEGYTRADIDVVFAFYVLPFADNIVVVEMESKSTEKVLMKMTGTDQWLYVSVWKYPQYHVITINNTAEVIVHSAPDNIFSVTDAR